MGGGDKLAEIAATLLERGVDTDRVLAILEGSRSEKPPPKRESRRKEGPLEKTGPKPDSLYTTHDQVLTMLAGATAPITVDEAMARLPGSSRASIGRHLTRGTTLGNVLRVGKGEPYTYVLTKQGRALNSIPEAPPMLRRSPDFVLQKLREAGPATAETMRRVTGMKSHQGIRNHLDNLVRDGKARRASENPLTWIAVGAETKAAHVGRSVFSREDILAKLREIGQSSADAIVAALGGGISNGAVRLHMRNAVNEGRARRLGSGNKITFTVTGARIPKGSRKGRKGTGPKPGGTMQPRGENDLLLVGALTKAGGPLNMAGFQAASPKLKAKTAGNMSVAFTNGIKRGLIKRVANGFYALPSYKGPTGTALLLAKGIGQRAPKAGKPSAGGKDGPAKQQSIDFQSPDFEAPANGNAPNGAAHAPN